MGIIKAIYAPICDLDLQYEGEYVGKFTDVDAGFQSTETINFREMVEKALKCKTAFRDRHSAWVYREGDNYTLGYVGFSDMTHSGTTGNRYNVVSKSIENKKYSSGQSNYHVASALHMDKAVRNAQKHLRPWSPVEHIAISFDAFKRDWRDVGYQADNEYNGKLNAMTNDIRERGNTFKELGHLLTSGYEFLYPNVRVMIEEIHTALSELNETKKRPKMHKFVYIREYFGEQQAARFPINADDYWFDHKAYQADHKHIHWINADDLDESEKRKISSLSFLENGQYIDGVGFKAASNCYYVVPEVDVVLSLKGSV